MRKLRAQLRRVCVCFFEQDEICGGERAPEIDPVDQLPPPARHLGLENEVAFCGHIDDVASVFNALDIVVAPSTQPEPFGLAVVEAMAARRPVIATAEESGNGVSGAPWKLGSGARWSL